MFVSESSLFSPSNMKIRICSMEGADIILEVNQDYTVDRVKMLAVAQFFDPTESAKISLYHKLVHAGNGKLLEEENTLSQEGIKESDELVLLKKRLPPPPTLDNSAGKKDDGRQGPSQNTIKKVTENVPSLNQDRKPMPEVDGSIDFHAELRKILISLIEAAQKILCLNPEASKIFQEAEQYLEEQRSGPRVNEDILKQLIDMGFPENRAKKALILNKMSLSSSIQWMIEHEQDADVDDPLPGMEETVEASTKTLEQSDSSEKTEISASGGSSPAKPSATRKVSSMLESFRAFRRKQFRPNPRSLKNLIDMGFKESDVIDALRVTGNKEEDACEWLLNGNKSVPSEDLEEGLDPDSPLYKAIMSNHVVQLGLNNPRSLLAFLHMLENPSNTQQWLNDPDTGPMLIQISRIYHSEKHAPPLLGERARVLSSLSLMESSMASAESNEPVPSSSITSSQQLPSPSSPNSHPS